MTALSSKVASSFVRGGTRSLALRSNGLGLILTGLGLTAAALALGGCAFLNSLGEPDDQPVIARGRTVIVKPTWLGADPLPTAQRYCASLGLTARPRTISTSSSSYDCV